MSEDIFKIRLGRIYSPNGHETFIRLARAARRGSLKLAGGKRWTGASQKSSRAPQYFQRRVIVKFSVVRMDVQGKARQALHLKYIGRDTVSPEKTFDDKDHGRLFDQDGHDVDIEEFKARGEDDPHQFRIIVSPEDSKQLADLEGFTRDLMGQMESELGAHLDWVGACHYDTATPHSHIVLRGAKDNGKALRIPRNYIAYGFREEAAKLVSLELGPVHIREVGQRLARQVTQERLTMLDSGLLKAAQDNIVDVGKTPVAGESWTRRLDIARLKFLSRMGLARRISAVRWQLDGSIKKTLQALGERGDILKAYHKALGDNGIERRGLEDVVYDFTVPATEDLEGKVLAFGIQDDVNDKSFAIIQPMSGLVFYVPMGGSDNLRGLDKGSTVRLSRNVSEPKPADITIARIAKTNGGIYSVEAHLKIDPSAQPEYVKAHIRRLKYLSRVGIGLKMDKGSWSVPGDYLKRTLGHEERLATMSPVQITVLNKSPERSHDIDISR